MEGKRKLRRKTSSPNYSDSGNGQKNVCKTVLIGDQIHRWLKVKMSKNLKSNVEVAKLLLDCYFSRSDICVETEQLSQAPPRTDPHPVISTSSSHLTRYEDGASDENQLPFIVKMEVDLDTNEHCETQTLSLYDSDSTTTNTTYPSVSTSSDPEAMLMSNKNSSLNIENIKTEPCSDDESAASDNRPFPVNMIAVNRPPASSRVEDNLAAPSLKMAKSKAQRMKEYRARKKAELGEEEWLKQERQRIKWYFVPITELSPEKKSHIRQLNKKHSCTLRKKRKACEQKFYEVKVEKEN